LPLRYVSSSQLNAQVPFDLPINSTQQLVIMSGTTRVSVPRQVVIAAADPAIYTLDGSGSGLGVIVDGDSNKLITPANPATEGKTVVVIYCNGLGSVNPPVETGTPAPLQGPLSQTANPVTATITGIDAPVQFAGLVPGYPDLYQVNALVPKGVVPKGAASVIADIVLKVAGQTSKSVKIGPIAGTPSSTEPQQ